MDKIVFNIAEQDRLFLERECEKTHDTFDTFFLRLLNMYKTSSDPKEPSQPVFNQAANDNATKTLRKPSGARKMNHEENSGQG